MIWIIILSILLLICIVYSINLGIKNRESGGLLKDLTQKYEVLSFQNEKNIKFAQECSAKHIALTGKYEQLNRCCDTQIERIQQLNNRINEIIGQQDAEIRAARIDAVETSKSVIKGHTYENLCPFFEDFPYNPKDLRHLASPVDYICFDGAYFNDIKQVIFLEIKTNSAQVTARQNQIRDAIENGRVKWEVFRYNTQKDINPE